MENVSVITQTLGRPAKILRAELAGELTEEDIALLGEEHGVKPTALKRLTDMHHAIARLVAQGEKGYAIALATGYSQSRISILKSDPAFQELVQHYASIVDEIRDQAFLDVEAKKAAINLDVLEIIHERVLDNGDQMPMRDLLSIQEQTDRKEAKGTGSNVTVNIAAQYEAGRLREERLIAAVPAAKAARLEHLPSSRAAARDE